MPTIGGIVIPDTPRPGFGEILSSAAQGAYGQVRYGLPYQAQKLTGELSAEDEAFYQRGLAESGAAASKAAPASLQDVTSGRVGITRFIGENLVSSLPYMVGGLAGGIAGGVVGGAPGAVAGAVLGGTPQFSGSNVARAVEEQGGLSQEGAERALLAAPFQAAADAAVGRFLPGAGKLLGNAAATQTGGFLARTAKAIAKAGATEAVTEAGQQIGERYAAGIPVSNADAAAEYVNAAVTAFAVGGALGVGGGFRRTNAHAKPAGAVTPDDMIEAIDRVLQPTLALPAPTDIAVDSEGVARANPSTATGPRTLALPSPEAFRGPDGFATPAGIAPTLDEAIIATNQPVPSEAPAAPVPGAIELDNASFDNAERINRARGVIADILAGRNQPPVPAALAAPTPPPQLGNAETSVNAIATAMRPDDAPVVTDPVDARTPRIFNDASFADLQAATKAKDADPAMRAEAEAEITKRYAEAQGRAPLTTDNFQERVDEVKAGLRGSWVSKLTATDPANLREQVYDRVFVEQDTASSVVKLAQRIGILDENLEPTPQATNIENARRTALELEASGFDPNAANTARRPGLKEAKAASRTARLETIQANADAEERLFAEPTWDRPPPADPNVVQPTEVRFTARPESVVPVAPPAPPAPIVSAPAAPQPGFEQEWQQLKSAAGIERERGLAATLKTTPANIDEARAAVFRELANDTSEAEVSQTEKLAKEMGLVTNDDFMDVTPLGRRTYLATPEGFEETVNAARDQGYSGALASAFDRGARSAVSGQAAESFTSFEDVAAYQAGRVWAERFIQTPGVATGAASQSIQARGARRGTIRGDAPRAEVNPEQVRRQSLYGLIASSDLSNVPDADIIALKRLVAQGADPATVGAAIQKLQGGESIRPAVPERAPSQAPTRGQPIFREMAPQEAGPSKAEARAETTSAVDVYNLRGLIEMARSEGAMTAARAQKLHDLLDAGKYDQVKRLTKDFDPDAAPTSRRRLPTPPERVDGRGVNGDFTGMTDEALESAIEGKSFMEVVDHMIEQAPSRYHREIMRKVKGLAKEIAKAGTEFNFVLVKPGTVVPILLHSPNIRALAQTTINPNVTTVFVKSHELGESGGTNFQVIAHEMLHAVTTPLLTRGRNLKVFDKTPVGKATKDLIDLSNAVVAHFNARARAGDMTEFEQAVYDRMGINALQNEREVLAWGLTNPDMQRYLQSVEYQPRQSVFAKLVDLLRNLLGLEGKYETALTELLRVSDVILGTRGAELNATYTANGLGQDGPLPADAIERRIESARTVDQTNEATTQIARMAEQVVGQINVADLGVKARRQGLGWLSKNQIDRQFGAAMPGLLAHSDAKRFQAAVRGRFESMGEAAHQSFERLEREKPKMAEMLGKLMALSTEFQLDPSKPFSEHAHLQGSKQIGALKRLHGEAVKMRNDLSRGDGAGFALYNEFRSLNEAQNLARMTAGLHGMIATDPELALGVAGANANPMDAFMTQPDLVTATDVRAYWQQALQRQLASAIAFVNRKKGEAGPTQQQATREYLSPIEMQIGAIHEALAGMAKAPYFHLGRFGDNFGSAVIRTNADGTVDPVAQKHVAEALEKAGFGDAQISTDNTRPRFSLRFETVDQTNAFRRLARDLQRQGWLSSEPVKAGPRQSAENFGVADRMPDYVQRYIQSIEASPMFVPSEGMDAKERAELAARKAEAVQLAVDTWVESQPDTSISKVLTKRYTVPGYNKDMIRNFAHRWHVGSLSLSTVAARPKFNSAYVDMRAQAQAALEVGEDQQGASPELLADLLNEVKRRDAVQPVNEVADTFDKLRAVSHSYFLGLSPAYALINMTQMGVVALPELAKVHGYGKSFHAMRRASTTAFAVLKAAAAEAASLGPKNAADLTLSERVLSKAGLSKGQADFLRNMLATGSIDIGTSANALGRVAKTGGNSKLDIGLKYASAIGLYSETFSRLVTALAAHELHGGTDTAKAAAYATDVVSNSMFDYQNWNTARQLGKQGFAGPITPLLTQFMSYSVQITEKLYSEVMSAAGRPRVGESAATTKQRQIEARRFLLGHLTAVTALAGTLGLPFATVFATVIERLVDAVDDDDEPYDATASWRGFLADALGKDFAEVVSRGVPRALGFDISARAGEQNLLPFSEFLADRRPWKEAIEANAGRSIGAVPSMISNVITGGGKLADGDLMGGLKDMLPVAFKGPIEAYRLTDQGYVDTRGTKLPMTPGATAILWQLLGFSPAERAEYGEARGDQQSRRGEIVRRAGVLRSGIVRAMLEGDQTRARELIADAQKFDQDNPAFAVIPSLTGSIQRQQTNLAQTRATRAPLGVGINDLAGQGLTRYANVAYQ